MTTYRLTREALAALADDLLEVDRDPGNAVRLRTLDDEASILVPESWIEPTRPLITDAAELAAAYGTAWPADACTSCGGKVIDGRCVGADACDDPTCTRACCASKRQGPVAVQRPGFGAS